MGNPAYQHSLVETLTRESRQATSDPRSESDLYDRYYGNLITAVQQVATTGYAPAWKALAEGNYNDDSVFAKWLSRQTEAQPILLQVAQDTAEPPIERGNVLFVLAQSCGESSGSKDVDSIRKLFRHGLYEHSEAVVLSSVRALGVCGTVQDIPALMKVSKTTGDRWLAEFARKSIIKIQSGN